MMRFTVAASVLTTTANAAAVLLSSSETPCSSTSCLLVPPFAAEDEIKSGSSENNKYTFDRPLRNSNNPDSSSSRPYSRPRPRPRPRHHLPLRNTTAEGSYNYANEKNYEHTMDIGILSSRRLSPSATGGAKETTTMKNSAFDLFNIVVQDKTNLDFLCDANDDGDNESSSMYFCSTCDRIGETSAGIGAVGSFDCQTPNPSSSSSNSNCYEINSRCPNNIMTVCRYDTFQRTVSSDSNNNSKESSPSSYFSERCRRIETTLTKSNRQLYDDEESFWEFSYCMRYNISTLPSEGESYGNNDENTCEMEVDGVVCSSCRLETVDVADNTLATTRKEFCATFDCGNTVLGYSGRFCNVPNLAKNAMDYFVYRSLPCDQGCNLCGNYYTTTNDKNATKRTTGSTMAMMKFRDSDFALPDDAIESSSTSSSTSTSTSSIPAVINCFEAQWKAMIGPTENSYCEKAQPAVRESCGCMPMTTISPNSNGEEGPSSSNKNVVIPSGATRILSPNEVVATALALFLVAFVFI